MTNFLSFLNQKIKKKATLVVKVKVCKRISAVFTAR